MKVLTDLTRGRAVVLGSLAILALFGCSEGQAPTAGEDVGSTQGLALAILHTSEDRVELFLKNESSLPIDASSEFTFAGRLGGNVLAIPITARGQVRPSCAYIDKAPVEEGVLPMSPGTQKRIWAGPIKLIEQWHCLEPGRHSVVFGYLAPSGDFVMTSPISINVEEGEAESQQQQPGSENN